MSWIAIAVLYFWAGATTAYGLWQVDALAEILHKQRPDVFKVGSRLRGRRDVVIVLIIVWPIALPFWAVCDLVERVRNDG